jgi:hypothetical protein
MKVMHTHSTEQHGRREERNAVSPRGPGGRGRGGRDSPRGGRGGRGGPFGGDRGGLEGRREAP